MATNKTVQGTCEICSEKRSSLKNGYGKLACPSCRVLMTSVKKRPEAVVKYMQEVHGDNCFPMLERADVSADSTSLLNNIKTMFRGMEDDFSDLPGIAAAKLIEIGNLEEANTDLATQNLELQQEVDSIASDHAALETNYGKMANKVKFLQADIDEQASIIKDLTESRPSPSFLLPEDISETGADIVMQCDRLKKTLLEKNRAYGDSALNPVRIFSSADPGEQLLVRIDDKLSRLARGGEFPGDDTIMDLIGYLILLLVSKDREKGKVKRETEKETP